MYLNYFLSAMKITTRVSNIRMITRRLILKLNPYSLRNRSNLTHLTHVKYNFTRMVPLNVLLNSNKAALTHTLNRVVGRYTNSTLRVGAFVHMRHAIFKHRGHITSMIQRPLTEGS